MWDASHDKRKISWEEKIRISINFQYIFLINIINWINYLETTKYKKFVLLYLYGFEHRTFE